MAEGSSDFTSAWLRWRERRLDTVNADDGPAALAATHWLDGAAHLQGVPGSWSVDDGTVILRLDDGAGASIDGDPVRGDVVAYGNEDDLGRRIRLPSATIQVIRRSGRFGVRLFDHALAGSIAAVDAYPPDPTWVVEAEFEPRPERVNQSYSFERESSPRDLAVPGLVTFTLDGRTYETRPFADEGGLLLVFADRTTGRETRPPSRFLYIRLPDTEAARPVVLDFNRAFLPPCAFSDQFNCPLPPSEHRLAVAVTAGEQWPRRR